MCPDSLGVVHGADWLEAAAVGGRLRLLLGGRAIGCSPWLSLDPSPGRLPRSGPSASCSASPRPGTAECPGHVRPDGGEAELGYLLLPEAWGCGYAAEACAAALGWFAGALPGEPVVLCTQTANDRSMRLAAKLGFTEVERFEEYGAEQWFGVWSTVTPPG